MAFEVLLVQVTNGVVGAQRQVQRIVDLVGLL